MHNQRSQNALTRSGQRSELSSFLVRRGGVRWLKSRSRLAGSGTNGSVFERFRACALALTLAFSTLLAGCGEVRDDKTPSAETPQATILPETMMPDPAAGTS